MKRLYLLRSARHRAGNQSSLADYHRPLTKRGEIAAAAMGQAMRKNNYLPELVICAAPARTRLTLANMWPSLCDAAGKTPELLCDFRIHLMRGDAMAARLREVDEKFASVMIISIVPGISDLARLLRQPNDGEPDPFVLDLPIGNLAIFECGNKTWAEITPGCGVLLKIVS